MPDFSAAGFQLSNLRLPHPSLDFLRFNRHEEQLDNVNFTSIVSTPVFVDSLVFKEYIQGKSVQDMVTTASQETDMSDAPESAVSEYVKGQLHLMQYLEYYMHRPRYFLEQRHLLPLDGQARTELIKLYYSFDEPVMLEFLGRKLNSRTRTYLPEVADRVDVPLNSCKRQFENLKRIAKQTEDEEGVPLVNEIMDKFALPEKLAIHYVHILFLNINRIDTTRRCLAHFRFADFDFCASILIQYWTIMSSTMTLDNIDESLTQHAQKLKNLLVEDKANFDQLCTAVHSHLSTPSGSSVPLTSMAVNVVPTPSLLSNLEGRTTARSNAQLRTILKSSFSLVADIDSSSTLRNVLATIVEKIVDPFVSLGLTSDDIDLFYDSVIVNASAIISQTMEESDPSIEALSRALIGTKLLSRRLFRQQKPSLFGPLHKIRPTAS